MNLKGETIRLKLSKSRLLLAEVSILMEHKFYASAINRLYYSCFHATKALLLTKDLIPKTHSGIVHQLHLHFVLPGSFDSAHATFFSRLMQQRMDDDYSDFIIANEDEVIEFIQPAKEYVAYIEALVVAHFQQNS